MVIDKVYFLAWPDGAQWTQKELEDTMEMFGNQYKVNFELTLNTRDRGYGQEIEYILTGKDQESINDFCEEIWEIYHI
jgi:hypothetical protein